MDMQIYLHSISYRSPFIFCHSEPSAPCHSEEAKRSKNLAQGKLHEESETLPLRFTQGQDDKGSYLSLFHAGDIPIFGQVILGIDYQVDDIESGIQSLQVIDIYFFKLLFIVEVGLLGQGIRFIVVSHYRPSPGPYLPAGTSHHRPSSACSYPRRPFHQIHSRLSVLPA